MAPNHDLKTNAPLSWTYKVYLDDVLHSVGADALGSALRYWDLRDVTSSVTAGFTNFKSWQLPWNPYGKRSILLLAPNGPYEQDSFDGRWKTEGFYQYNAVGLGMKLERSHYLGWAEAESPSGRARNNVLDKIQTSKASAGVAMAEISKTAALVADSAKRLAGALRALRKAQLGKFMNELGITVPRTVRKNMYTNLRLHHGRANSGFRFDRKSKFSRTEQESRYGDFLAQTWLEVQYGWKPLLQDIYSHAEATAATSFDSGYQWRTVIGSAKTSRDLKVVHADAPRAYDMTIKSEMWSQIRIDYRLPHGYLHPAIAFGLTNPALIAWELVPFSFIVDWFYPIGSMLERLTAHHGLQFHRGVESFRNILTVHGRVIGSSPLVLPSGVRYVYVNSRVEGFLKDIAINRYILNDFPSPDYPKWKDPRSISHGLSAIALLKSNFLHSGRVRI